MPAYQIVLNEEEIREGCTSPKATLEGKSGAFASMFSSHLWQVEYMKPHGDGVYAAFNCQRCGAIGHAVIEKT